MYFLVSHCPYAVIQMLQKSHLLVLATIIYPLACLSYALPIRLDKEQHLLANSPLLTDVTIGFDDPGSTLSEPEGATFGVCVNITQDAPSGRECPIDVTLTYDPYGDSPWPGE